MKYLPIAPLILVAVIAIGCVNLERAIRHERQDIFADRVNAVIDQRIEQSLPGKAYRSAQRHAGLIAGAVGAAVAALGIGGGAKAKNFVQRILASRKGSA